MDEMYPTSRMDFSSELDKRPFPKLLELGGFHATEDSSVCGTLSWVNQLSYGPFEVSEEIGGTRS